ncbi:S-formylglutathione hydrolase [Erythrobacter sp. MTPC3]|uniref:S-formylglutathione hydrolase n=1 Tax=Erythrobacter sp. MTPC3 TaxID=3056564 RepID=UPI0036F3E2F8
MTFEIVSETRSHGGVQGVYSHASEATGTDMTFAAFVPGHRPGETLPVLWYLSGLTCTHANVMEKGEYRSACARHGIILIAPDTSPRGEHVPDADNEYDFGKGAGFYVDASQAPWDRHYRMRSYIEQELPELIAERFPADMQRQSIMGHSMGGHGALTIGLRNPDRFRSISAFSPIAAPSQVPWGTKALGRYLGQDQAAWREYDATSLVKDGARHDHILIDQGTADNFLEKQLKSEIFVSACEDAGLQPEVRMQDGYDHSYFFISTFMAEHVGWHAKHLKRE